jgi:type II secretory pathway component PulC
MQIKPKFVYDEAGNRVEVILAMSDYQAMLKAVEDAEDRAIFEERRHEKTVSWESVKAKPMNRPTNLENALSVPPAIADVEMFGRHSKMVVQIRNMLTA